jgi:hypothetical protein
MIVIVLRELVKMGYEWSWRVSEYDCGIFLNTQKKITKLKIIDPDRSHKLRIQQPPYQLLLSEDDY